MVHIVRTNIEIDDKLMAEVLASGRFKTKKEAVEAGLLMIKRQEAMRELARMGGAVTWGWDHDEGNASGGAAAMVASEPSLAYSVKPASKSAVKGRPGARR